MEKINEDELDNIFSKIIFLIYRNKCIWHDCVNGVPCGGYLETSHLIPRGDKYFKWDMNNAVVMCSNHHKFWHGTYSTEFSQSDASELLNKTHPELIDFLITNKNRMHQYKPDISAIKAFLLDNKNEAIEKGKAPFPSLYGKFIS